MLSENEMEILACFFPRLANLTSRQIELKTKLSHETVFRILKDLVKKNNLKKFQVGKTNVYEFIKDDFTYQIFVHWVIKKRLMFKEKYPLLYKRLYEFLNEIDLEGIGILFGSYAKGTEKKDSDIDLLCVTDKVNVRQVAQAFHTKYRMNFQPLPIKRSDFKNIKQDNPQFWNDLLDYGLVLDGLDLYFKEVYR